VTYSTARISGGHINPAVSLALLLIGEGQMSASKCVAYVLAQLTGALMAAAGLRFLCPNTAVNRNPFVTQGILSDGVSRNLAGLCIFEFIMTFTLMFVICAVALDVKGSARQYAPLVIGFTYAACMYCEGPYTGGSMNPARTLSAAIVFNDFTGMWVSLIAMFGGAVCGAFAYKATFNIDRPDSAAATSRSIVSQYV
jgi:MIP family channel proteins